MKQIFIVDRSSLNHLNYIFKFVIDKSRTPILICIHIIETSLNLYHNPIDLRKRRESEIRSRKGDLPRANPSKEDADSVRKG